MPEIPVAVQETEGEEVVLNPEVEIRAELERRLDEVRPLFSQDEALAQALNAVPNQLLQGWSTNNPVIAVVAHPDILDTVRKLFQLASEMTESGRVREILEEEVLKINFAADPGLPIRDEQDNPIIRMIHLREHIGLQEVDYLKHWAENELGLNRFLSNRNVPFMPTVQELRLAFTIWATMEAAKTAPKIQLAPAGAISMLR